jgi:hypothetical protein
MERVVPKSGRWLPAACRQEEVENYGWRGILAWRASPEPKLRSWTASSVAASVRSCCLIVISSYRSSKLPSADTRNLYPTSTTLTDTPKIASSTPRCSAGGCTSRLDMGNRLQLRANASIVVTGSRTCAAVSVSATGWAGRVAGPSTCGNGLFVGSITAFVPKTGAPAAAVTKMIPR